MEQNMKINDTEKMKSKNKNLSYEDLKAKPGYSTYGFTNWVDNILEDKYSTDKEELVLPIQKKLEISSSLAGEIINLIERELKGLGEITKGFYYQPMDMVAYLVRTSDHWHEILFSNFGRYALDKDVNLKGLKFKSNEFILKPHIFLRHPKIRFDDEMYLDNLIFENFGCNQSFDFSIDGLGREIEASLLGIEDDKKTISKILSIIPYYEEMIRDPYNLNLSKRIEDLEKRKQQKEENLGRELKVLTEKEIKLKSQLRRGNEK